MAPTKIALRASESERETWEQSAEASGLKLSAWLRRAANSASDLEAALRGEELHGRPVLETPPTVEEVRDKMYPQSRKRCIHRLQPNTYCKQCQTIK